MLIIAAILLTVFIINVTYLFISYNFFYDLRFLQNLHKVQNYYILKEEVNLFKKYFEQTDETVYTQLYWIIPPQKKIDIGYYYVDNPEVDFVWRICFNEDCYNVNWQTQINIQWTYQIVLITSSTNWMPYLIKGVGYNYTCNNGVYEQVVSDFKFKRTYTVFTSLDNNDLNFQINLNPSNQTAELNWTIPGKNEILDKYIIKVYKNNILQDTKKWNEVCVDVSSCTFTIPYNQWDTFKIEVQAEGILKNCGLLTKTG